VASIRRELVVEAPADEVWEAFRDVGAVHTRLAEGFVTDTRLEGRDERVVTFVNDVVAREKIVDLDDEARRLAYSAGGGRLAHHNASFQVFAEGADRTRIVWIADLLPNELAPTIAGMMEQGSSAMKRTLERAHTRA